ncbi:M23 family metallopeptidase [Hymenobacter chitinivorans]|uniref:Peptidase M23-like protein n=1 Tax=Hymenobacter chitinivorans DSM 11115 TaxID=1121954 RepID=A0A2M9BRE2_9BACT|nr:M23 family metallopeptidase [Hymenobacter chitinivorans]PJJ60507.1 peptidase M23-like protein [Hymenobacter chitinivorans DSM 11115]
MPRLLSYIFLLLSGFAGMAQNKPGPLVSVEDVKYKDGSTVLVATNRGFAPCTIFLEAELLHMTSDVALPAKIVVFPSPKPQVIAHFTPQEQYLTRTYTYWYGAQLGICNGKKPDTTFIYRLPLPTGTTSTILQARTVDSTYSKPWSHAVIFRLPENTPVCAARAGVVTDVRQDSDKSGGRGRRYDANMIVVFHDDGTYAVYTHFRQNGAAVQAGQRVNEGDVLGFSGNTGWVKEPCLGFNVQYSAEPDPRMVPTLFQTTTSPGLYLKTGQTVTTP